MTQHWLTRLALLRAGYDGHLNAAAGPQIRPQFRHATGMLWRSFTLIPLKDLLCIKRTLTSGNFQIENFWAVDMTRPSNEKPCKKTGLAYKASDPSWRNRSLGLLEDWLLHQPTIQTPVVPIKIIEVPFSRIPRVKVPLRPFTRYPDRLGESERFREFNFGDHFQVNSHVAKAQCPCEISLKLEYIGI